MTGNGVHFAASSLQHEPPTTPQRLLSRPAHAMTKPKGLLFCLLIVGLFALAFVGAGMWFFFGDSIRERWSRQRFDSVAWQSGQSRTNAMRIRMVDDLMRRHIFRGMSRNQITAILGEPDETGYFKEWDMVYWLGPERSFMSVDSEWLVFRLDGQKKVTDYKIVTD
jgi:hypothetical protein